MYSVISRDDFSLHVFLCLHAFCVWVCACVRSMAFVSKLCVYVLINVRLSLARVPIEFG